MRLIGLTGGIASGKSTVSQALQAKGALIIDADLLAREVVLPQSPAWIEIRDHFGQEILTATGELNRAELGRRIFTDASQREVLNRITHRQIEGRTKQLIAYYQQHDPDSVVVVDAPLLFEVGMDRMVEEVWVVAVDETVQMERLQARDGLSREEARQRLASQMPLSVKLARGHQVIDNNGTVAATLNQVELLWQRLVNQPRPLGVARNPGLE